MLVGTSSRGRKPGLLVVCALALTTCALPDEPRAPEPARETKRETTIVSALGVSPGTWTDLGPAPMSSGGARTVELIIILPPPFPPIPIIATQVAGAIHAFSSNPTNANDVVVATVNGGLWRTTNALSLIPAWTPVTDDKPSLSIVSVARDPANPLSLVAGTGGYSNFLGVSRALFGRVYKSIDGGTGWSVIDNATLRGHNLSGADIQGQRIVMSSLNGAIFRSPDGGGSWGSLAGGSLTAPFGGVLTMLRDPSNADNYYFAIGGGPGGKAGIYRAVITATNTVSFTRISQNDPRSGPTDVTLDDAINSADNIEMAAGTDGRIYVVVSDQIQCAFIAYTSNQGATWTRMDIPRFPDPFLSGGDIVAVSAGTPMVVTTSADHNLGLPGPGDRQNTRLRLAGLPAATGANGDWIAQRVLDAEGGVSANQFALFSRITGQPSVGSTPFVASGAPLPTWRRWFSVNPGGMGFTNVTVAVDPSSSSVVYLAGDAGFFVGTGGIVVRGNPNVAATAGIPSPQWGLLVGAGTANNTFPHADSRFMEVDAAGGLINVSDGGIVRMANPRPTDPLGDWKSLNGSIGNVEMHDVGYDTLSGLALGGVQDNGSPVQHTGTSVWELISNADGNDVQVDTLTSPGLALRYTSGQFLDGFQRYTFDATGNQTVAPVPVLLQIPGDGGTKILRDVDPRQFVTTFELNAVNPFRMLIAGGLGLYESANGGDTLTPLGPAAPNSIGMAYGHPTNADALWAVAPSGIFFRSAAGTPPAATALPAGFSASTFRGDVVMGPANAQTAFVVDDAHVYRTTNGGGVWDDMTGDLDVQNPRDFGGFLHTIVYVPSASGDRLVVSADAGVFMSNAVAPPVSWSRIGTNLPNAIAFDLAYAPAPIDVLVVGLLGRGAWRIGGVSALNRAPTALCKPFTANANAVCKGVITAADINNGSFDPDGDPLSFAINPAAPLNLGPNTVTLTVSDNKGASSSCQAQVTVIDVTPPVLSPVSPVTRALCDPNGTAITLTPPTATDNCPIPPVTGQVISSTDPTLQPLPRPVVNGQVTLSAGVHVIRWSVSDGPNTVFVDQTVTIRSGVYATQSIDLRDRARVQTPNGTPAMIINSGNGPTHVGVEARVGDILSAGAVTVDDRAIIGGFIRSRSSIRIGNQTSIVGPIQQFATINFPPTFTIAVTFPPTNQVVNVEPDQPPRPIAPGAYSLVAIKSRSTGQLRTGDYFIHNLDLEPQATFTLNQTAGPVRIFVRDSVIERGNIVVTSGSPAGFTFGYFGTAPLFMERPFTGILVAPNAATTLGGTTGQTFAGQFYLRSLTLQPDDTLICREDLAP